MSGGKRSAMDLFTVDTNVDKIKRLGKIPLPLIHPIDIDDVEENEHEERDIFTDIDEDMSEESEESRLRKKLMPDFLVEGGYYTGHDDDELEDEFGTELDTLNGVMADNIPFTNLHEYKEPVAMYPQQTIASVWPGTYSGTPMVMQHPVGANIEFGADNTAIEEFGGLWPDVSLTYSINKIITLMTERDSANWIADPFNAPFDEKNTPPEALGDVSGYSYARALTIAGLQKRHGEDPLLNLLLNLIKMGRWENKLAHLVFCDVMAALAVESNQMGDGSPETRAMDAVMHSYRWELYRQFPSILLPLNQNEYMHRRNCFGKIFAYREAFRNSRKGKPMIQANTGNPYNQPQQTHGHIDVQQHQRVEQAKNYQGQPLSYTDHMGQTVPLMVAAGVQYDPNQLIQQYNAYPTPTGHAPQYGANQQYNQPQAGSYVPSFGNRGNNNQERTPVVGSGYRPHIHQPTAVNPAPVVHQQPITPTNENVGARGTDYQLSMAKTAHLPTTTDNVDIGNIQNYKTVLSKMERADVSNVSEPQIKFLMDTYGSTVPEYTVTNYNGFNYITYDVTEDVTSWLHGEKGKWETFYPNRLLNKYYIYNETVSDVTELFVPKESDEMDYDAHETSAMSPDEMIERSIVTARTIDEINKRKQHLKHLAESDEAEGVELDEEDFEIGAVYSTKTIFAESLDRAIFDARVEYQNSVGDDERVEVQTMVCTVIRPYMLDNAVKEYHGLEKIINKLSSESKIKSLDDLNATMFALLKLVKRSDDVMLSEFYNDLNNLITERFNALLEVQLALGFNIDDFTLDYKLAVSHLARGGELFVTAMGIILDNVDQVIKSLLRVASTGDTQKFIKDKGYCCKYKNRVIATSVNHIVSIANADFGAIIKDLKCTKNGLLIKESQLPGLHKVNTINLDQSRALGADVICIVDGLKRMNVYRGLYNDKTSVIVKY